jgi:hypothetical protein
MVPFDTLGDQLSKTTPLSQPHHRDQARSRHKIRLIEHRIRLGGGVQQSHLTGAPLVRMTEASATPIVPGQGHLHVNRAEPHKIRSVDSG